VQIQTMQIRPSLPADPAYCSWPWNLVMQLNLLAVWNYHLAIFDYRSRATPS